jgi:iron complex outermembrane receptor protein
MVYARFAEGYRGGGFDGQPLATNLAPYRAETVRSYELGTKTQWLDDRVRINADVYRSNYSNLQRTVSIQGSTLITQNAASARIQGAEVESIFLATQHLKLNLSGGYLDAGYERFFADVLGTGIPMDLSHMRFPFSPRWSGNAGAEYDIPIGEVGRVVWNLDYSYQTSQSLNIVDSPETTQGPYGLLGASLTFNGPRDRYHVSVYGKNILNKQYRVDFEPVSGLASTVIDGMPATWGISVGAKF